MDHSNKPYVVIILIQSIYAGMYILSKVAFDLGMNTFVFVFYRQAAAALFLAPIAMYIEGKSKPQLTFNALVKIFLHSLFGITMSLNIYGVALIFTSATLASATANTIPVITFLLAAAFRMENVKLKTIPGIMKLAGIALCAVGAGTIAFYKGPYLKLLLHHHLFSHYGQKHPPLVHASNQTWIKGVFLMLLANCLWGLWIIFQGNVMKSYPSKLLLTTLECFLSSIQSFVISIAMERDPSQWKLGWNVRLLAVAYCGVVVTGFTYYLQAWVIEMKGPVFLAMTSPLGFVITIVCSAFLLGEVLGLGSILGGILLVGGLYCVLWGKSKEQQHIDNGICKPIETEVKKSCDSDGALTTKTVHPSLIV